MEDVTHVKMYSGFGHKKKLFVPLCRFVCNYSRMLLAKFKLPLEVQTCVLRSTND